MGISASFKLSNLSRGGAGGGGDGRHGRVDDREANRRAAPARGDTCEPVSSWAPPRYSRWVLGCSRHTSCSATHFIPCRWRSATRRPGITAARSVVRFQQSHLEHDHQSGPGIHRIARSACRPDSLGAQLLVCRRWAGAPCKGSWSWAGCCGSGSCPCMASRVTTFP